jgi:hypothetical protein
MLQHLNVGMVNSSTSTLRDEVHTQKRRSVDKFGRAFRLATEAPNGSVDRPALLLAKESSPSSSLLVSIFNEEGFI